MVQDRDRVQVQVRVRVQVQVQVRTATTTVLDQVGLGAEAVAAASAEEEEVGTETGPRPDGVGDPCQTIIMKGHLREIASMVLRRSVPVVLPEEECQAAAEVEEEAAEIMVEVPLRAGEEAPAEAEAEAEVHTVLPEAAEVVAGDLLRLEIICRCLPTAAVTAEEACRRMVEEDTEMTTAAFIIVDLLHISTPWEMLAHTEIAETDLMVRRHQCRQEDQEDHHRHMERKTDTMIFAATACLRAHPRARTKAMDLLRGEVGTAAATETTAHLEDTNIMTALPDSRTGMIPAPLRPNTATTIATRDLPDLVTADTTTAESNLEDRTVNSPISRRCHHIRISSMVHPLDLVAVAAARRHLR